MWSLKDGIWSEMRSRPWGEPWGALACRELAGWSSQRRWGKPWWMWTGMWPLDCFVHLCFLFWYFQKEVIIGIFLPTVVSYSKKIIPVLCGSVLTDTTQYWVLKITNIFIVVGHWWSLLRVLREGGDECSCFTDRDVESELCGLLESCRSAPVVFLILRD